MRPPPNRTARAACPIGWQATENAQGQIVGFISANSYVSTDGGWVISYAQRATPPSDAGKRRPLKSTWPDAPHLATAWNPSGW